MQGTLILMISFLPATGHLKRKISNVYNISYLYFHDFRALHGFMQFSVLFLFFLHNILS